MKKYTKQEAEKLYPGVIFEGDVRIGGGVVIERGVRIESGVHIGIAAHIERGVYIGNGVIVGIGAHIGISVIIERGARIGVGRRGVTKCLIVSGIGEAKSLTALACDDGLIITIGCLNNYKGDTIENARKAVSKKYSEDHEYFDALNLCEKWYKNLKDEK